MKNIIIAIDGHSSCGKSTLAKALAKELGYVYIDTGAMYRAVTLFFLNHDIDFLVPENVEKALKEISIQFKVADGGNRTFLNGNDVENEIRSMRVSAKVSEVAEISSVRKKLVEQQQSMGMNSGIVMDGRDIGTVVFPEAELKIFLTADPVIRALRRFNELKSKGVDVSLESIKQNLLHRDNIDSNRADSPLKKATDAIVLDSTHMDQEEQLNAAIRLYLERVNPKN